MMACVAVRSFMLSAGMDWARCLMSSIVKVMKASTEARQLIVWPVLLSGLFVLLYASIVKNLILQWWSDPNYGHGFFVLPFSCYILWRERERWTKSEVKPGNFGLV